MLNAGPVVTVKAWLDAVNAHDIERLIAISDPNIELVGPRGSAYGHQILRDWLARARLHLETLQIFARDDVVVIAQHGIWRSVKTGEITGEHDVASRFHVAGQQIVAFARYDNLNDALAEVGLTSADQQC